jgi:hypothetical protein
MCAPVRVFQVGETVVIDEVSGNRTIVPILQNVTSISLEGCLTNRSSACLSTCADVGYLVCVPETDPFDLCVQSCIANLTYIEPAYVFDQSVAVCKKKLRLTPSQGGKRGAAWYRDKQPVREGFRSSFAFKLDHVSKRCAGVMHPSYEARPEAHDMLCKARGGDGFAFVVQDAGRTSYDAACAYQQVVDCVEGEAQVCLDGCKSMCPAMVVSLQVACVSACLRGATHVFPRLAGGTGTSDGAGPGPGPGAGAGAGSVQATAEAAAAACEAYVGACVSACDATPGELQSGAAMQAPNGCLYRCLSDGAQAYCEARCPLVDEDLDWDCIDKCKEQRLGLATTCYGGCSASCASQAASESTACEADCSLPNALMPSGEPVARCRAAALAHPIHDTASCLVGCAHTNASCLSACAERPEGMLAACVDSCPPGNTRCIAECIKSRETLGRACIVPKLTGRCNYTSVAIGDGASGVGYGSLRNALAIKFDTWYNYEEADPWLSHVAVHSGGFSDGAPARATQALGLAYDMPDLNDGKYHEVLIEYSPHFDSADAANPLEIATLSRMPAVASRLTSAQRGNLRYLGMLSVHLDGKRILRVPLNLEELLTLDGGRAYVGFTSATGTAFQEHSILNWRFNASKAGTLLEPANLHCRHRVPSLWHAASFDGAPIVRANQALGCTPDLVESSTPPGAMHSLRCAEDPLSGVVYCQDPNMPNVPPMLNRERVPLLDVAGHVGKPFVHVLPRDSFLDKQSDGRLTSHLLNYTLQYDTSDPELAWLTYDAPTRTLRGTPTAPGMWPITVVATDPGFRDGADPPLSTTDVFYLQVVGVPVVSSPSGERVRAEDVAAAEDAARDAAQAQERAAARMKLDYGAPRATVPKEASKPADGEPAGPMPQSPAAGAAGNSYAWY